ncbi:hypothetical protein LIA77_00856 [Sarocladium implicatum]|nr:hypothetical protein LIA77_00856 [Sarocladium implicatum]
MEKIPVASQCCAERGFINSLSTLRCARLWMDQQRPSFLDLTLALDDQRHFVLHPPVPHLPLSLSLSRIPPRHVCLETRDLVHICRRLCRCSCCIQYQADKSLNTLNLQDETLISMTGSGPVGHR